jgi:hypothetical protein
MTHKLWAISLPISGNEHLFSMFEDFGNGEPNLDF